MIAKDPSGNSTNFITPDTVRLWNNVMGAWCSTSSARRILREAAKKKPIGLLACCSRKLTHPAPAKSLYCSALFKKQRAYIEAVCGE